MPRRPLLRADAALATARMLAWALLIGGWLALAALGRQVRPLAAGGLWLPAIWLLGMSVALAWAGRRPVTPAAQAGWALGLAGLASLAALGTADLPVAGAVGLALGWGGLLAVAATVVRGLRGARAELLAAATAPPARQAAARPALPTGPAAAGALLAWALSGGAAGADAASLRHGAACALALAALALTILALVAGRAASACRSGLFDCAWPPLRWAALRHAAQWPQLAAGLAMLPMMAALPWMADWCGRPGAGPAELAAQHLAAMLLPALLASALPRGRAPTGRPAWRDALPRHGVAVLLALGGLALIAWPGRDGLAAAAIVQGLAWSLAWRLRLAGAEPALPAVSRPPSAARGLGASALALLLFGLALDAFGPQTLVALHAALALAGLAGGLAALGRRARHPASRSPHEKGGPQAALHPLRTPSTGAR